MSEEEYSSYIRDHERMILRDHLAVDRTMLANETSFMSYVRTSLTLIAVGATVIKFFNNNEYMQALGWVMIVVGGWLSVHGYVRYRKIDAVMHKVKGEEQSVHNLENTMTIKRLQEEAVKIWRRH